MRYTLEKMNYEKLGYEHTNIVVWVKSVYKGSNALGLSAQQMYINYSLGAVGSVYVHKLFIQCSSQQREINETLDSLQMRQQRPRRANDYAAV